MGSNDTQPPEPSHVREALVGNLRSGVRTTRIAAGTPQQCPRAVPGPDSIDHPLEAAPARIDLEERGWIRIAQPLQHDPDSDGRVGRTRCPK